MIFFNISNAPLTNLKRKARYRKLILDEDEKIVKLVVDIHFFENNAEAYGSEVDYSIHPEIQKYERILKAHNGTLVNPDNEGTPVYNDGTEEAPVWKDMETNLVVASPIGYYDFFMYVMVYVPTIVMDSIATNIAFEDSIDGLNKKG